MTSRRTQENSAGKITPASGYTLARMRPMRASAGRGIDFDLVRSVTELCAKFSLPHIDFHWDEP